MKENNKLLAEFLGWEQFGSIGLYDTTFHNNKGSLHWLTKNMRFHNDWNWLMEVVEKIESIETEDGRTFTIDMHRDSVLIFEYGMHTNEIIFTEGKGRFENLYNACVQFVEWLNKENN